jgi:hypothetical protein
MLNLIEKLLEVALSADTPSSGDGATSKSLVVTSTQKAPGRMRTDFVPGE